MSSARTGFDNLSKKNGYTSKIGSPQRRVVVKGESKSKYNNVIKESYDTTLLTHHYIIQNKFTISGKTFYKALSPHREIIFIYNDKTDETLDELKEYEGRIVDDSLIHNFFSKVKMYVYAIIFDSGKFLTLIERSKDKTEYTETNCIFDDISITPPICRIVMKLSEIIDNQVEAWNTINQTCDIVNKETFEICQKRLEDHLKILDRYRNNIIDFLDIKQGLIEDVKERLPILQKKMNQMLTSGNEKIFKSKEYKEVSDELRMKFSDLDLMYRAHLDITKASKDIDQFSYITEEYLDQYSE